MARQHNRNGNAKLLESQRQRAKDISQTTDLGERHAFGSGHQNAKISHGQPPSKRED
jgi:hypothetical protein